MINIKGIDFDVEINFKRIRNMYLRLDGKTIVVSAPNRVPKYEIYRFIESRRDWIYKTYDENVYKNRTTHLYRGGDIFYIFNVPYRLVRNIGRKNVTITDRTIYLTYKDDSENSIKYLYSYLDKYLLDKAYEYYEKYRYFLIDYGYYLNPEIKCKIMSSRWGVCFIKKNKIHISSYLIHYPLECLEYIMVHEMTHFIIPNHSKRFYDIVGNNMPDYNRASDLLKN